MAFPTSVNPQITDAVEPPGEDASPLGDTVNSQVTDAVTDGESTPPLGSVTQAVLLANGTTPAKAVGTALGSMAQAASLQMANSASSYQSWKTVQHATTSKAAGEILAGITAFDAAFDAPAHAGQDQGT